MKTDLDKLHRLHAASTQGEWHVVGPYDEDMTDEYYVRFLKTDYVARETDSTVLNQHNAAWIAAIHNAWPEVERMLAEAKDVQDVRAMMVECGNRERLDAIDARIKAEAQRDTARAERDAAEAVVEAAREYLRYDDMEPDKTLAAIAAYDARKGSE